MGRALPITEHSTTSARHTTAYLACGDEKGPPIIFVHGWPEMSLSWRHQLPCVAALGFRAIAPDMRGYGRSSIYTRHEDYAVEHSVADMLELLAALGHEKAIWVGHDWGSPVVWSIASHHPERCHGVANLCVPYLPLGFTPQGRMSLIDRNVYPEATHPYGQWDYQIFYKENFEKARAVFEADVEATVRTLFRKGSPDGKGKPSPTSEVRKHGGWFRGLPRAPNFPRDEDVITEEDLQAYASALRRNGFFGPGSWYMNDASNEAYARKTLNGGRIDMPVLFLHGAHDYTCETLVSPLAQPMRDHCKSLTEAVVPSGHWMAQERPTEVNSALVRWLAAQFPDMWSPPFGVA